VDGTTAAAAGVVALSAPAQPGAVPRTTNHYHVPANDKTVHSGYFSKSLKPLVEVASGDFVTIEVLTHHANDGSLRATPTPRRGIPSCAGPRSSARSPATFRLSCIKSATLPESPLRTSTIH